MSSHEGTMNQEPAPETEKIKGKRGGPRPGSGRKPNYLKRLGIKAITAAEILAHHDEPNLWYALLHHKSPDIRLRTLSYLTDRRDRKPKQAVDVSGGIVHAHTVYRNPQLAATSLDELQVLDGITKKLALPAPDGPHNQTQSDAATNAVGQQNGTLISTQMLLGSNCRKRERAECPACSFLVIPGQDRYSSSV